MKKKIISKEIFDEEISICKEQSKNGKCAWGECNKCGVIPLLHKLHKGQLLENPIEISRIKSKVFK